MYLSPYSYGYNNPVKYNDPSGHTPVCHSTLGCSDIVTFDSTSTDATWTDAEMEKVISGANAVAAALLAAAQDGQFADAADAWDLFTGHVTLVGRYTPASSGRPLRAILSNEKIFLLE